MTQLKNILTERIAATGPLTVADYMAECLMHPQWGYYQKQKVFGAKGDFTTAPEISQMFGELVGLALAQTWINQGRPQNAVIVELGPGRGTLMKDIRRATKAMPGFANLPVHMVETSAQLRTLQSKAVPGVIHHSDVDTLPQAPLFLVANEFFDTLPIRQFVRSTSLWAERMVGAQDGELIFGLSPPTPNPALQDRMADTQDGDMIEHCPALAPIVAQIGTRIADHGGAALFIDYGHWRSKGDTLQALEKHSFVSPLDNPGHADLTAHVDFEAIAKASAVTTSPMTTQGVFLERLGITPRAQQLAQNLRGAALEDLIKAHRRLTHPSEMGDLFKIIGLARSAQELPPGLEP
ncbi:MAG: class I SAM-dependent methyltransferase [Planktomarina sp.]